MEIMPRPARSNTLRYEPAPYEQEPVTATARVLIQVPDLRSVDTMPAEMVRPYLQRKYISPKQVVTGLAVVLAFAAAYAMRGAGKPKAADSNEVSTPSWTSEPDLKVASVPEIVNVQTTSTSRNNGTAIEPQTAPPLFGSPANGFSPASEVQTASGTTSTEPAQSQVSPSHSQFGQLQAAGTGTLPENNRFNQFAPPPSPANSNVSAGGFNSFGPAPTATMPSGSPPESTGPGFPTQSYGGQSDGFGTRGMNSGASPFDQSSAGQTQQQTVYPSFGASSTNEFGRTNTSSTAASAPTFMPGGTYPTPAQANYGQTTPAAPSVTNYPQPAHTSPWGNTPSNTSSFGPGSYGAAANMAMRDTALPSGSTPFQGGSNSSQPSPGYQQPGVAMPMGIQPIQR